MIIYSFFMKSHSERGPSSKVSRNGNIRDGVGVSVAVGVSVGVDVEVIDGRGIVDKGI